MATDNSKEEKNTFANVLRVLDYLTGNNWKVSRALIYEHKKDKLLRPREDGLFHLADVKKYAANFLHRIDGSGGSDSDRIANEKAQAELDKTKEQLERLRWKRKMEAGAFVPREAFEQELAKRAAVFKSDGENFIRAGAEKIIALVGGDPAKAPALIEYQLDAEADRLNRYSGDKEFKVPAPIVAAAAAELQDTEDEEDE
jgi:hypothetical protein